MGDNTVLGMVLGLSASILINVGNNLQSKGMHDLEVAEMKRQAENNESTLLHPVVEPSDSKTWILGTVVFLSSTILNFSAMGFAPQGLLQCLESVQFVSNVLFGKFVNGKEISWRMLAGVIVTIGGCCIAVLFAPGSAQDYCDVSQLSDLFKNPILHVYVGSASCGCVGLWMLYNHYIEMEQRGNPLPHSTEIRIVCYSVVAAVGFGTPMMVCGKMVGYIVAMSGISISGNSGDASDCQDTDIFQSWFPYVIIVFFVMFCVPWLTAMNQGLMIFDPLLFVPMLNGNFILWGIISAGICFQELNTMQSSFSFMDLSEPSTWLGFIGGVLTMFLGLYLICYDPQRDSADKEDLLEPGLKSDEMQQRPSRLDSRRGSRFGVYQRGSQKIEVGQISRFFTTPAAQLMEHQYLEDKIKIQEQLIRELACGKTISAEEANEIKHHMIRIAEDEKRQKHESEIRGQENPFREESEYGVQKNPIQEESGYVMQENPILSGAGKPRVESAGGSVELHALDEDGSTHINLTDETAEEGQADAISSTDGINIHNPDQ